MKLIIKVTIAIGFFSFFYSSGALSKAPEYINPPHDDKNQEIMRLRTEGVAHFESGIAQKKALAAFEKAISLKNAEAIDHFNLGVIQHKLNKKDSAKISLKNAIEMDSSLPHPYYFMGLIYIAEENNEKALESFKESAKFAPNEPSVHYQLSRVYRELGKSEEASQEIINTLRLDPYHTGALYQLYLYHQQKGDKEKAQQIFKEFSRLKKAFGKTRLELNPDESRLAKPLNGQSITTAQLLQPQSNEISLSISNPILESKVSYFDLIDLDQDRQDDLIVIDDSGYVSIYLNSGNGTFSSLLDIKEINGSKSVFAVKLIRDKPYSLLISTDSEIYVVNTFNKLDGPKDPKAKHHNAKKKDFNKLDIGFEKPIKIADFSGEHFYFTDIDHDGDSDIVIDHFKNVLINKGDASFEPKSNYLGVTFSNGNINTALNVSGDSLRGGINVDYVVTTNDGKQTIIRDDMGGKYSFINGRLSSHEMILANSLSDMDNNGLADIILLTPEGLSIDYNHGGFTFKPEIITEKILDVSDAIINDFNNDGFKDVLYAQKGKGILGFIQGKNNKFQVNPIYSKKSFRQFKESDLNNDGLLDLIALDDNQQLQTLINNSTTTSSNWISLDLEGIRSAPDGRFTQVEVRYGSYYAKYTADGGRLHIPLGAAEHAELVRISWPNGFVENMFTVEANKNWYFSESERISGSCPSIYTWDGSRYRYITDAFISGPMGVPTAPGEYFPVGDDEYLKIPGKYLKPDADGLLKIAIVEELREVTYLDQVQLLAIDYPNDHLMFPNEYLMPPDFPKFELLLSANAVAPSYAVDHRGTDVTDYLANTDYTYPYNFARSTFTGFADTHYVEISLTDEQQQAEQLRLFLSGWFYYFDSTSLISASQSNDVQMVWPQIQALVDGEWKMISRVGIPPGKEKTVMVDLSGKLPANTQKIRVVTNLEMYWDQILIDSAPIPDSSLASVSYLDNHSMTMRLHGFSKLIRPAGEFPMPDRFDYHDRQFTSLWDPLEGKYTRYGDVLDLVNKVDSQMAVFSSGDEVAMVFDSKKLPSLKDGYQRDYLLYLNGFVKDGDKYTAHAGHVEPMPFKGMDSYPYSQEAKFNAIHDLDAYQKYIKEYQTRDPLKFTGNSEKP